MHCGHAIDLDIRVIKLCTHANIVAQPAIDDFMPAIDVRKPDETPCMPGEALDTPREAFATRAIAITTGGEPLRHSSPIIRRYCLIIVKKLESILIKH